MHSDSLRVLLVEDDADHARLIGRRLRQIRPAPAEVHRVSTFAAAVDALAEDNFAVVLLDLRLPDSPFEQTLPRMIAAAPDLPIIVLTSLEEFDFALDLVKQGAQDYIVKSRVTADLLSRAIYYAVERKRVQSHLQHYAAELERTNRELDQFTRVVSHDLKSPLAVMQMELQLLSKALDGDTASRERVGHVMKTTEHMRRLIDDLLLYARTGEDQDDCVQVDCDGLFGQVVDELKPMIESAEAQITRDPLPRIWGNATRLAQLASNLLTNAIKYRGEARPCIHVSAEFHGPDWVFSVKDNGIGIPSEDAERIFDVFTRLHGEEHPGTGIGLAICKRAVESHGGRIWVDSAPGQGTTFYFSLPSRRPSQVAAEARGNYPVYRAEASRQDGVSRQDGASRQGGASWGHASEAPSAG